VNALDQLNQYLARVQKRLQSKLIAKGLAIAAAVAFFGTVGAVLFTNSLAFSDTSLLWARFLLFVALAATIVLGLVLPWLKLSRRASAKEAEKRHPEFEQRLITLAEQTKPGERNPFLELVASDATRIASKAEPKSLAPTGILAGLWTAGTIAALALVWLITSGPGYWGHGAALLWMGPSVNRNGVNFYDILVTPGDRTVRRKSDQLVTAQLVGFDSTHVTLKAKYASSTKWEELQMQPQPSGNAFEFLFASLSDPVEYYVESEGVKSKTYHFKVIDLPNVTKMKVTYHFPAWSGMKDETEDPGGDLRAVEGTVAEVSIQTDRPLKEGVLIAGTSKDEEKQIKLEASPAGGNRYTAKMPITKDGMYHLAAIESGEAVRLTDDYFIESRKDMPPTVKIVRPGKDAKVNPIEEVTVAIEGEDDFGLKEMALHYTVNGGEEKTVQLLKQPGARKADGQTLITLEDYKLVPGDLIGIYASAKDARQTTKSDIFFVEAQPFERNYSQSQESAGGGGGGQQEQDNISKRQKEVIAATWNESRRPSDPGERAANAKFLAEVEGKLRDQARSLADRVKARQLAGTNDEFKTLVKNVEEAGKHLDESTKLLQSNKFQEALSPEQKALQYLLRVEAASRDIQVAFGSRGGGGGGGGAARDLDNLFDLEMDTEKNQYETGQRGASEQRRQQIDELAQKLQQLARRQQELAQQQQNQKQGQTFQQKWQQELLRREAEELQKQLEQLSQQQQQQQQGQQGQQGQQSQQGQQGQQGQQSSSSSSQQGSQGGQQGQMSRQSQEQQQQQAQQQQAQQRQNRMNPADKQQLEQALKRLQEAAQDMRRANSSPDQAGAGGRRAADRLQEAEQSLQGLRHQQSSDQMSSIGERADEIARRQAQFEKQMQQMYGRGRAQGGENGQGQPTAEQNEKMAEQKEQLYKDLDKLEKDMQQAVRDNLGTQPKLSSKLRDALGDLQQSEVKTRMKMIPQWIRRGQANYTLGSESIATATLDKMREQLADAQKALDPSNKNGQSASGQGKEGGGKDLEAALEKVERLRAQLQQLSRQQGQGQGQRQSGGMQRGEQGQQGQGQQSGSQQGQQQGGQQPGSQQGGQMSREGGDPNGNQSGARGGSQYGGGYMSAADADRALREGARDLGELRQMMKDNPELARELGDTYRSMQRMNGWAGGNDAELEDRLKRTVLPNIESIETQLRRQLDEQQGGQVRSGATERAPDGFADKVAEYFRRLSKGDK
jgi:hypothetical protein